jgi:hypothetical protein
MRLKETDPHYRAVMLLHAANGAAIESMQARRRGQPDRARQRHQDAQGMRELARGLLNGRNRT